VGGRDAGRFLLFAQQGDERGAGRVVAFADEWITFDSEWQNQVDVPPFWANLLAWLSGL
jgi:uncharacterized protein YciU (UPF0263 family)